MSPAAGQRIGAFEITGSLGAGGMGEVYRATDTKLLATFQNAQSGISEAS